MNISTCRFGSTLDFDHSRNDWLIHRSKVNEDSILAVQVFDQKKFKKKDQGFLGVINVRIGDVIELAPDAEGMALLQFTSSVCRLLARLQTNLHRNIRPDAHARP